MNPTDARIVLTGATGGIGRAAAARLVEAGASLLLVGRSPAKLAAQARELVHRFGAAAEDRVRWHAADLNQPDHIARLRDAAAGLRLNVLVLGAGVPSFGALQALTPQHLQQVLQTNLLAPMLLTQALLPALQRCPRAQLICMGSALGRIGLPGFSAYSASKFGLRGFAEALRRELADTGVRVQYLGPRSTRTAFNDERVEAYNARTRTAMDAPDAVAAALLQLLSSEAPERFLGFPEKLAVRLNGLAPALMDRAFVQHRRSLPADTPASTSASTPR
ncbi:MAG: SDR family oxidoreductase [Pseudomonadota bacterium]